MDPVSLRPLSQAWLDTLYSARRLLEGGRPESVASALAELPPEVAARPEVLVGALCLGRFELAVAVAIHGRPDWTTDQGAAASVEALCDLVQNDQHRGSPAMASWIADTFALSDPPETLLEGLRLKILIETGSSEALVLAIKDALALQDWSLTFKGIERLKFDLGMVLDSAVHGLAATCLHHLGRYEEANQWVNEGLGEKARLIAPLAVPEEAEILARFAGKRHPVVSIICAAYNHERFIEDALRGFLGQDCPYPYEILIHDDASTDGTQSVIRHWQSRYPNLIRPILQVENQFSRGVRPWELMLEQARGDFVALCEGDDYWIHPGKLTLQISHLLAHPDVTCSAHNHYHFRELMGSVLPGQKVADTVVVSPQQLMAVHKMLWTPTMVFRRTFAKLPPERELAAFGDQFLISYLGTFGKGVCFDSFFGAVRRENEFSTWSPLAEVEKERRRIQTWSAIERLQRRLGNLDAANQLARCIAASPLTPRVKSAILADSLQLAEAPQAG